MIDKEAQELDSLYNEWRKKQDIPSFQNIYMKMKPDIDKAAYRASFGSNVPQSAHKLYAAQAFHDALKTYRPESGANLKTHVYGSVQNKAKRLNYMYQDLGYKPEPRATQVGRFQTERENLRLSLGRDPTDEELAKELEWSVKDVALIQKEVVKDLSFADGLGESSVMEGSVDEEKLHLLYYDLTPEEQTMFDYVYGKHGKPKMQVGGKRPDYDRIARVMNVSPSKARGLWTSIGVKLKKVLEK